MKILLVGVCDTNSVSLAPQLLSAFARKFSIAEKFDIQTCEFSIFSDTVESITNAIQSHNPDIVGFSCYIWNYNLIRQITPHLDCTILLGEPQVNPMLRCWKLNHENFHQQKSFQKRLVYEGI